MKRFFLILLIFVSLDVVAQNDYFKIKEGSFTHVVGAVMDDAKEHTDVDNKPMALFKISTENINDEERRKLYFTGNRVTEISDKVYKTGSVWIYVTAEHSDFLEIRHPDYGVTRFYFPESLCDFCTYEMVLQYIPFSSNTAVQQNNYLTITADQPNASIYIDDEYVSDGFKSLAIGTTHTWRIDCELYHTESGTVTITEGEPITIEKKLRPAYGFINISSMPENGAVVFINDKKVGMTPYKSDKMASGTYKVRVVKDMYKTAEQTFVVSDGNTTEALLDMKPNFVTLTVDTDTNADIYIDNQYKAKGRWNGRISDGVHFVEVKKDKHRTVSKNINLVLGKDENIKIETPEPITGFLDVSTLPVKADIYLNGKHYGTTPRIISNLLIGDYTLKLEKEGCAPITKNITIEENQTVAVKEQLQTGKEIVIKTDKSGDMVYIDENYVGTTPLTTNVSYGKHKVKAARGSQITTKIINVEIDNRMSANRNDKEEFVLAFGKLVMIYSNNKGDDVYIDGKKKGTTPYQADLSLGSHEVEVRRGKLYETKTLQINKNSSGSYNFVPKKEPLDKYLSRGINFITLNAAYSSAPQTSFGLTYGRVKRVGWYVSAMSGLDFTGFNTIDENYEEVILTGETASTRLSVMGGIIVRIGGPVYFKTGAGLGMRMKVCETIDGNYVEYKPDTFKGVDLGAGLQFNLRNITFGVDAVTTNFKYAEVRLGIGVNWN